MFVVTLTYKVSVDVVDGYLEAHREYLREQYAAGVFLASGPRNPRVGGVILARAENAKKLREILERDPFSRHDVAEYDVVEFSPLMTCEELEFLRDG